MSRLDASLRTLDAASVSPLTIAQRERSESTLEGILASGSAASLSVARSRRWALPDSRWLSLAAVAAAAVVTVAVIVFPGALGGGRAYGSWTPVPTALTASEIQLIGHECLDGFESGRGGFDADRARVALAERRGEFAMLLYRIENPETSASCLAHNIPGSDDVDDVKWGMTGSSGPAETTPPGTYSQGAISDFVEASVTDGAVGEGVTGITIHASNLTVQASVTNGRYVAWWPGPAFKQNSEGDPVLLNLTYDVTLSNGTVLPNAQPHR
ncbi:hypothetical protein FB565_000638 [Actinoplanes lutulentus]|uniref:Uncharacterized protein n=1 Tax=Actinoplanes lutulentus TaxID=1287878 RepID=A0A327ZKP1_9ACTN|nr:hypothetical protein [Actinoplanes lutulentus]MBB2940934.1 hypothetical protein [Actinoplanes lutulentus]RAK43243.1 hypothetical protein B0I29_101373 [Actinoplanes lutulentus]